MIARLRRLLIPPTLQRRVGTLTAFAVLLGVALTGFAGYLTARVSLYDQLDHELTSVAVLTAESIGTDLQTMGGMDEQSLRAVNATLVLLKADGTTIRTPGERTTLVLGPQELAMARLQQGSSTRSGVDTAGAPYRIASVPLPQGDGRYALVIGRPLEPTLAILDSLRNVLVLVGSIGILLATVIGQVVARSSVRPVQQLSAAVARVTQTDVLDPIEVRGNDELSELTRSFNTMLDGRAHV